MKYLSLITAFIISVTITGCGESGPRVQFVEGTVTLDGKPVTGADIGFAPQGDMNGYYATGKTDAEGRYTLTATRGGPFGGGAVAGVYAVRVVKLIDPHPYEPTAAEKSAGVWSAPLSKPVHHLPEKYADTKTSGLTAEVKKGKNIIDFDLKSK